MDARLLLGLFAIAGLAASALGQASGVEFQSSNHVTFVYVQGPSESKTARFDASTVVHINSGFIISSASQSQLDNFLGTSVSSLPSTDHPTAQSITMRVYWEPDPSGAASVLPAPVVAGGTGRTTVFRSNIILGIDRPGVPLRLTAITFSAN